MRYTAPVFTLLVAGHAYAATFSDIFPRQSPEDLLGAIPPACASQCQPLTSLQTSCTDGTAAERIQCVCTDAAIEAMEACTECAVTELAAGLDPEALEAGVEAAQAEFRRMCSNPPAAGGSGTTGGAGASGSATTPAPAATSGASNSGSNTSSDNTTKDDNAGLRIEVASAAFALVASAIGALVL